jgi:predicted MFS family arabinose efflux permease
MIDRVAKRRVLVFVNAAAALILPVVPLAQQAHLLSLGVLIVVSFLAAGLVAADDIALMSALPRLVEPTALGRANGVLSAVMSVAAVAGPALLAALLTRLSGPWVVGAAALTFAIAAVLLMFLPELPAVATVAPRRPATAWTRLTEGLQIVSADRALATLVWVAVSARGFTAVCAGLEAVFIVGHLGVSPRLFALAFTLGGLGAFLGSVASGAMMSRVSTPLLLAGGLCLTFLARGAMSMLHGSHDMVAIGFGITLVMVSISASVINVAFMTAVQSRTPPASMGQVIGTVMSMTGIAMPIGALIGAGSGAVLGVRPTLMLASLGFLMLAMVCAVASATLGFRTKEASTTPEMAD